MSLLAARIMSRRVGALRAVSQVRHLSSPIVSSGGRGTSSSLYEDKHMFPDQILYEEEAPGGMHQGVAAGLPLKREDVLWKEMSARQDTAARGQTLSVRTQAAHPLGVSLLSRPPIPMWLLSLICAVRRRSAFGFELTSQPEPRLGLTAIPANLTVFESKSTFWMPLNVP